MEQSVIYIGAGLCWSGSYWVSCWPWGPRSKFMEGIARQPELRPFLLTNFLLF